MSELSVDSVIRSLQKKQYVEAMNETEYGWKNTENFPNVCCPSDLNFISIKDERFVGECHMDCKDCWEYTLKNKWKD